MTGVESQWAFDDVMYHLSEVYEPRESDGANISSTNTSSLGSAGNSFINCTAPNPSLGIIYSGVSLSSGSNNNSAICANAISLSCSSPPCNVSGELVEISKNSTTGLGSIDNLAEATECTVSRPLIGEKIGECRHQLSAETIVQQVQLSPELQAILDAGTSGLNQGDLVSMAKIEYLSND
ncbi:unnamed protein product [Protopolystoma xenopodis]|uniref:Uncharacterized protein n=1 Tax=Protopolystoma xenopodis TaxID=117903 RepID=A0A448XS76_9PLAT|nr:unnamed protein product [Protopolystoma xenopodis]